jgi:hypothetical protein
MDGQVFARNSPPQPLPEGAPERRRRAGRIVHGSPQPRFQRSGRCQIVIAPTATHVSAASANGSNRPASNPRRTWPKARQAMRRKDKICSAFNLRRKTCNYWCRVSQLVHKLDQQRIEPVLASMYCARSCPPGAGHANARRASSVRAHCRCRGFRPARIAPTRKKASASRLSTGRAGRSPHRHIRNRSACDGRIVADETRQRELVEPDQRRSEQAPRRLRAIGPRQLRPGPATMTVMGVAGASSAALARRSIWSSASITASKSSSVEAWRAR